MTYQVRILMLACVRSTLILDDDLFKKAKHRAARDGTTLSAVVNQALRECLREEPAKAPPFTMVTFGSPRRKLRHEPADLAAALDEDDRRSLR